MRGRKKGQWSALKPRGVIQIQTDANRRVSSELCVMLSVIKYDLVILCGDFDYLRRICREYAFTVADVEPNQLPFRYIPRGTKLQIVLLLEGFTPGLQPKSHSGVCYLLLFVQSTNMSDDEEFERFLHFFEYRIRF